MKEVYIYLVQLKNNQQSCGMAEIIKETSIKIVIVSLPHDRRAIHTTQGNISWLK